MADKTLKVKVAIGVVRTGDEEFNVGQTLDMEEKEARKLIDRGIVVESDSKGEEKLPNPTDEKPPKEVLKAPQHEAIQEVAKAEQLPNKQSQK
jgi:hypothetical protein